MTKIALFSTTLAAMLVALLPAAPAQAQAGNQISFVSTTGSGSACTKAAPCFDFQTAHDATSAGGEIICLDSGGLFGATISKDITIDCAGTAATTDGFVISAAGIVVSIRNLSINGFFSSAGNSGISFNSGAVLFIENCVIQNFRGTTAGNGILFQPSASGRLVVTDSFFVANGTSAGAGGGIIVNPQSGGSALVSLDRVTVSDNNFGIVADGSRSTAGIAMVIKNSTVQRNPQGGIVATTPGGGAPMGVAVKNTSSVSNNVGIRATGIGATVRVSNTTVMHNGTGLAFNNGGALLSFGNNEVEANGLNGTFSGPVTLK